MIDFIAEYIGKIALFASGGLVSFGLAFISPFATQWITKRFARKPAFSISSARLGTDLLLEVRPLNALANKKKNLNIRINGANLSNVANYKSTERGTIWVIDFTPPHIRAALMQNEQCEISFFFDADLISDPVVVKRPIEPFDDDRKRIRQVDSIQELLYAVNNNTKIYTFFEKASVGRQFPLKTDFISRSSIFDGKEIVVSDVNNLEISGSKTHILHYSRYAWVITFKDCTGLILDNLIIGHEFEGYCLGGVLRFLNCSDIHVKNCDLFGCGTFALEFQGCRNIEVTDTIMRDCSYGIANIYDTNHLVFSNCKFLNNRELDLINIGKDSDEIMFQRCVFRDNVSSGFLFKFEESRDGPVNFNVWKCEFNNNSVEGIYSSDEIDYLLSNNNSY